MPHFQTRNNSVESIIVTEWATLLESMRDFYGIERWWESIETTSFDLQDLLALVFRLEFLSIIGRLNDDLLQRPENTVNNQLTPEEATRLSAVTFDYLNRRNDLFNIYEARLIRIHDIRGAVVSAGFGEPFGEDIYSDLAAAIDLVIQGSDTLGRSNFFGKVADHYSTYLNHRQPRPRLQVEPQAAGNPEDIEDFEKENIELRPRPNTDGVNNFAHNMNVKYTDCVGLLKEDRPVLLRQFYEGKDEAKSIHVMGYEYLMKEVDGRKSKEFDIIFNEKELYLPRPQCGWVMSEEQLYFIDLIPGSYLRGISNGNMSLRWQITKDSIFNKTSMRWNRASIMDFIHRPYVSLEEGLDKRMDCFAMSPILAAILRKKAEKEKLFILYQDLCIGEYVPKRKHVRLYRYYDKYKHLISRSVKNVEME